MRGADRGAAHPRRGGGGPQRAAARHRRGPARRLCRRAAAVTALVRGLGVGSGVRAARLAGPGVGLVAVRRRRHRAGAGVRRRRAGRRPGLHARPRRHRDLAGAVLGVAFVMRAVGDVQESWPGRGSRRSAGRRRRTRSARTSGGGRCWSRCWPSGVLAGVAVALARPTRRRRRPGRPTAAARRTASRSLSGPVGLACRLQRGTLIGWAAGLFLLAASMGSLSRRDRATWPAATPPWRSTSQAAGSGSLTDSFFSTMLLLMALLAAGFAVSSTLRLRGEESAGRLEPLLATGLSRTRWLLGSLVVTVVGRRAAARRRAGSAWGSPTGWSLRREPAAPARRPGAGLRARGRVARGARDAAGRLGAPGDRRSRGPPLAVCFVLGWLGGLLDPPRWVQRALAVLAHAGGPRRPRHLGGPGGDRPGRRAPRGGGAGRASAAATC